MHQPEDFGAWLSRREEREDATLERLEALFTQREKAAEERTVTLAPRQKNATTAKRELKERVDAELRRAAGINSAAPKTSRGPRR